jgi:hypothetical protein
MSVAKPAASASTSETIEKKNVVDASIKEKTSADYYFNSYSHFGEHRRARVSRFRVDLQFKYCYFPIILLFSYILCYFPMKLVLF